MSNRTIQNIFQTYSGDLARTPQPLKNRKAIYAIEHCRTRDMGVSYYTCKAQHHRVEQYHSCRNRSCFLCSSKSRRDWIESQTHRLFNTPHFHVVFTLPHEYLDLWRYNEALMIKLIFKASKETLLDLMSRDKHQGVTPGVLMALHTWGRQLSLHPHVHCLVTAGGLQRTGEWKKIDDYLLPGKVMKLLYRGKFQSYLKESFEDGHLIIPPDKPRSWFWDIYRQSYQNSWNVRVEERYEHGKGVMLYLARYIKGGPINPNQINSCTRKGIGFKYLDHRTKRKKQLIVPPKEFITRLLSHVPPVGIHTIRYYGLYASSAKRKREQCQKELGNLNGVKLPASVQKTDMLLSCTTCGERLQLSYRLWKAVPKGISINKGDRGSGHIQQDDDTDISNSFQTKPPDT